jgi:predicted acetylornithine/succinylornithine family transaminase/N-acetyl-ornithine/N-acetyl-lysine deacetylase
MNTIIEQENTYTSGVYGKRPVAIVRGSGASVWDAEGREYIDCIGGYGVANIGHGRPEIAATLAAQAQRIITSPELVYNDVRAQLLERLVQVTPEGLNHVFLCNSGTEAVEGALKFARIATGRTGIIATLRSFHGRTMGALSATWEPHYREPFAPLVPEITHIRYNDFAAAETAINEQTATVILELVQGEGGVHVADDEYVQRLAALCHERGALLIVDEVQTGFGRTGALFACNHYNLQPDILCLAKAIAGGVPMGAICLGPRVMQSGRISKGIHGSTFGGNPLACAAALTTLDIIEREELPERTATLGAYIVQRLRAIHSPLIREVRGRGLLIGIELTRRSQPTLEALLARGILALQAGPNVVRLLPPLVISDEQVERVLEALEQILGRGRTVGAGTLGSPLSTENAHTTNNDHVRSNGDRINRTMGDPRVSATPNPTPAPTDMHNPEIMLLHNMLTIASYSRQEGTLAHYLVEQARIMGLHAYVDEVGNFVASTHERENEQQPVVLLGHMDTVTGNIPVRFEDDLLYGRGAVDAKGPLAAFLCAVARLARSGNVQAPIVVIGAVEEEAATSRGARAVVERYHPSACIIGEPSGSQAVTIGYKGRLLIEYRLARPMSHSAGFQQHSNEVAVAFWERVRSHAAAWNAEHAPNSAFAALSPSLRSINTTTVELDEEVQLLIGYRLPLGYDITALRAQLEQWAEQDGASLSFSGEEQAFQTTRTTPLARSFIAALRATGVQPTFKYKTGTADMNVVGPFWGQNIVAYGPGDSSLDHTPNEHIRVPEYCHAIDVLERVLTDAIHLVPTTVQQSLSTSVGRGM